MTARSSVGEILTPPLSVHNLGTVLKEILLMAPFLGVAWFVRKQYRSQASRNQKLKHGKENATHDSDLANPEDEHPFDQISLGG